MDRYEQQVLDNVENSGCHITTVFDPDGDGPIYSYSAGFTKTVTQGEVIVFGLAHDLMGQMINRLYDQCADGLILADQRRVSGLLQRFDVVVRSIPAHKIDREHFNTAMWFHRHTFATELRTAFQLVWPGAVDGLFPWDPGSDAFVRSSQPPLYEKETIQ